MYWLRKLSGQELGSTTAEVVAAGPIKDSKI